MKPQAGNQRVFDRRGRGRRPASACARLILGVGLATLLACPGVAQDAAFFKGKTIRILLSAGVAGGYAEYAHLLAQHMGDHLPGKPDFIVQSMPGAGGLLATNYLYAQAWDPLESTCRHASLSIL